MALGNVGQLRVKYLNNYWMDYNYILYRCWCSPKDDFGPLTFIVGPP